MTNVRVSSSHKTILLVDDDPPVRNYLNLALQYLGFRVESCEDVTSALRHFKANKPALILTDCNLPAHSGVELIRAIRSIHEEIPLIGMSGEHFKGKEMLQAGATAFLPKPVEMSTLQETLEETVKKPA